MNKNILDQEKEEYNKSLKNNPTSIDKLKAPQSVDPLQKAIIDIIEQKVQEHIKQKIDKPQEVYIKGKPQVTITFPETQKIEGQVKILNEIIARIADDVTTKVLNFPEVQKIIGAVDATVKFPDVQKIEGNVDARVKFPDVQKIQGEVKTNIPVVSLGNGKIDVLPVAFYDGMRFVNPFSTTVQSSGRVASAVEAVKSLLTGILKMGGRYNSTAPTLAENEVTELRVDVNGNLKTTLATLIAGEDLTNNVLKVEQRFSSFSITTQTTTTVKSGEGFLHAIEIPTPVANATVKIYDNTAASGTVLLDTITFPGTLLSSGPIFMVLNKTFSTGLTIVTAGATMSVSGSYR